MHPKPAEANCSRRDWTSRRRDWTSRRRDWMERRKDWRNPRSICARRSGSKTRSLTHHRGCSSFGRSPSLPGGVMVAQATLTRLVMVRIHAGQPSRLRYEVEASRVNFRSKAPESDASLCTRSDLCFRSFAFGTSAGLEFRKIPEPFARQMTTDGACDPNPGPGGWAAILRCGDKIREMFGSDPSTTNNRMEMRAVWKDSAR
jgi:hypothetical protein